MAQDRLQPGQRQAEEFAAYENGEIREANGFRSLVPFRKPDDAIYSQLKGIHFMHERAVPFEPDIQAVIEVDHEAWQHHHGKLVDVAARGRNGHQGAHYPRIFPGPVVPGPEGIRKPGSRKYIGSTAAEILGHMLAAIPERVVDPSNIVYTGDRYVYEGDSPHLTTEVIEPPQEWAWEVTAPQIEQVQLGITHPVPDSVRVERQQAIQQKLAEETAHVGELYYGGSNSVRKEKAMKNWLSLAQTVWSPHVEEETPEEIVEAASKIYDAYIARGEKINDQALLLQLHSALRFMHGMRNRQVIGRGKFGSAWFEVARTPIEAIQSTELINVGRAITEVDTMHSRGWAPIVTDEQLNNTDGSHRYIAANVWNVLQHLQQFGLADIDIAQPEVQAAVRQFVAERPNMQGLTMRETLRVAQALLTDPELKSKRLKIARRMREHPQVTHLPTVLLPEQEALCVVKGPYDNDGKVIGVDPFVTWSLTAGGKKDRALGSRGPYHLTDQTEGPWFNISQIQHVQQSL